MHDWGWSSFTFDWLINPDRAIYRCHRRHLAVVGLRDGDVPAGLRGIDNG
jgi:glucose/mannose transport system permease protein